MAPHIILPNSFRLAAAGGAPVDVDVRTLANTDVVYSQIDAATSFGGDWDISFPTNTGTQRRVVMYRFVLDIPQGATIISAVLSASSNQNQSVASPADDLLLAMEQADNVASPTSQGQVDSRWQAGGPTALWRLAGTWNNSVIRSTQNLAGLLQQIVNRPGWVSGNAIGLWTYHYGNAANNLQVRAHATQTEVNRPRLQVTYRTGAPASSGSVDLRVAAIRDSITNVPASSYWAEADPLYLIGNSAGMTTALRFTNVTIPKDAIVTSARLTVWASTNMSADATAWTTVGLEQVDNAGQLTSGANHESRKTNLGGRVRWEPHAGLSQNDPFYSRDMTAIVQEIVNRSGWSSGNALQFFVTPNPSTTADFGFRSYWDALSSYYPRFEATWMVP